MAKNLKTKWLGARVDDDMSERVTTYIDKADGIDMAILIRLAVDEYIKRHPVMEPQEA